MIACEIPRNRTHTHTQGKLRHQNSTQKTRVAERTALSKLAVILAQQFCATCQSKYTHTHTLTNVVTGEHDGRRVPQITFTHRLETQENSDLILTALRYRLQGCRRPLVT